MRKFLLTNDDGINAKGMTALISALSELGEIYVVAPDGERSACSHGITMHVPMTVKKVELEGAAGAWTVSGLPADCIKLGVRALVPDADLVISGINMGANVGDDVFYSGTVSGAAEGLLCGIPSIAVSICSTHPENYEPAINLVKSTVKTVFEKGLDDGYMLNINLPDLPEEKIKGTRVAKLGKVRYAENFLWGTTNMGAEFCWYNGEPIRFEQHPDSDVQAIRDGYISVVPLKFDVTYYEKMKEIEGWDFGYNR